MAINSFTDSYTRKNTFTRREPLYDDSNVYNKLEIAGLDTPANTTNYVPAATGAFGSFTAETISKMNYPYPSYAFGKVLYEGPQA